MSEQNLDDCKNCVENPVWRIDCGWEIFEMCDECFKDNGDIDRWSCKITRI